MGSQIPDEHLVLSRPWTDISLEGNGMAALRSVKSRTRAREAARLNSAVLYSTFGVISFPAASRALVIENVARIHAIESHIDSVRHVDQLRHTGKVAYPLQDDGLDRVWKTHASMSVRVPGPRMIVYLRPKPKNGVGSLASGSSAPSSVSHRSGLNACGSAYVLSSCRIALDRFR